MRSSVWQRLKRPDVRLAEVAEGLDLELTADAGELDAASLETEVKYEGYVARQRVEVVARAAGRGTRNS